MSNLIGQRVDSVADKYPAFLLAAEHTGASKAVPILIGQGHGPRLDGVEGSIHGAGLVGGEAAQSGADDQHERSEPAGGNTGADYNAGFDSQCLHLRLESGPI